MLPAAFLSLAAEELAGVAEHGVVEAVAVVGHLDLDDATARRAHLDADVVCAVCEDATDAKDADLLLCDLCNVPLHTFCLDPPLDRVPETAEWLCPACAGRWASSK